MSENRTAAEQRAAAGYRDATDAAPGNGEAVAAKDPVAVGESAAGRSPAAPRDVEGPSGATTAALPLAAEPPPARAAGVPRRPARSERQEAKASSGTGVRRAQLALRRIDPWSVFVLSLLVSLFLGIVLLVAVGLLFLLLQSAGVIGSVDKFARELSLISQDASVLTGGRVMTVAAIVAAVDVVVLTVLATLGAILYNVCASFTGGIEVTLAERE